MKYFLFILLAFVTVSCSETSKVGCADDSDCADDRICDVASKSCVTCKATMCNYDNASGVCEANSEGKIHCALGDCDEGFVNIDGNDKNGCEYSCVISNNGVEICDTKDNNCDGQIDEGLDCSCNEDETNNCIVSNTSCDGTQSCVSGSWGECTTNDTTIGIEVCDGIDNDCNDGVDEDFKINGIYAMDNHCGACNQKCEDNHGTNSCDSTGKCNPVCESGWTDFDKNGLNGCETGCDTYLFSDSVSRVIASSESDVYIENTDAFYLNNEIITVYIKRSEFAGTVTAMITDKNGEIIKENIYLASLNGGEFSVEPQIYMNENYNYILYRDEYLDNTSKKLKLVIKDHSLNLGNSVQIASVADYSNISKKNYVSGKIFTVWTKNDLRLGGGTVSNVYFRAYDEETSELGNTYRIINNDDNNLKFPKITTALANTLSRDSAYIAVAYCELISHGSVLRIYASEPDANNFKIETIDTFTDSSCGDFDKAGSVTSDGDSVYVSYVNNNNLNVKKYGYSIIQSHGIEVELKLLNEFSQPGFNEGHMSATTILWSDNSLLLGYTKYFTQGAGNLSLINNGKGYMRFTENLKLKDHRMIKSSIGTDLNSDNTIMYTEGHEIILVYKNGINENAKIEISRTSSCEN